MTRYYHKSSVPLWPAGEKVDVMARAVQFTEPRQVRVAPVVLPTPRPGRDLVVRTTYSGISAGTELLAYRGELDSATALDETLSSLSGSFRYPFSFGYSCVGRVEIGTAAIPEGSAVFAFHPHQDRFVVAEDDVVALDAGTDPRLATLFPLVETALQLTLDAGPVAEETVVVAGLGPVGLLTAMMLNRAGAHVLASEPRPWRREIAASLGVSAVAVADLPARLADETGGRGASMLVELSGVPQALAEGLSLLAHEGTALVGSWYGTKPVPLPLGGHFHRRRLTVRSSQVSTIPVAMQGRWDKNRRRRTAAGLLDRLPLRALATTEYAFDDAPNAYAALDRGDEGVLHAALRYE
jgi:2-desacetyl-2-hydroxyethyl bacteriochlorophyllide A dehydrogenase